MSDLDRVIRHITTVARKSAQQVNPVLMATVLSRNPDGTLNVDDGKGGCARRAAPANVKIGDKIPLGTEPGIGTTTGLVSRYFIIANTGPCPPQDIPTKPLPIANASGEERISSGGILDWANRDAIQGNGLPNNCTTWFGERNTVSFTNVSGVIGGGGDVHSTLKRKVTGACTHQIMYNMGRTWVVFDMSASGAPTSGIVTARLKLSLLASTASLNNKRVVVLLGLLGPSDIPITVSEMDAFDRQRVLGSFPINGHATGVGSYGVVVDLDLAGIEAFPDPFSLCLMTEDDWSGTPPPTPVSVTDNVIYGDTLGFYTHPTQGAPILELDVPEL